jgi:DNA polymerase-3 subunit alpha
MSFTFIESLVPTSEDVIEVLGLTFTAPAVLEDNLGIRYLVLPDTDGVTYFLHGYLWALASSHGVQVIAAPGGGGWHMDTKEHFVSSRKDRVRDAGFEGTFEVHHEHLLTYTEMHSHPEAEAVEGTFVHVHTHSDNSALDGLSYVHEIVAAAVADGNTAVAITDHGNCAAHPALQIECDKAGIKPMFGMEAYLVPNRHRRGKPQVKHEDGTITPSDSVEALSEYTHVTLWAATNAGLRNLWSMSTEGYREGFYGKPRIDWETLTKFNEGVYASTGCLRGPLAVPLLAENPDLVTQNLGRMLDIFGERLVVEIHTNHLDIQMGVNRQLVDIARKHKIRMVAAVDSHYAHADEAMAHRAWLAVQTDKDITQESGMFGGGQDYHMHTEAEVRAALSYLGQDVVDECVSNTMWLANQIDARIEGATTTPTFSVASAQHPDPVQRDCERLIDLCLSNWSRAQGKVHDEQVYMDRFEREMSLLTEKHFCGYFLLVAEYVNWAEDNGILVGPGRGSGGGSLVAYLSGIVKIDPVEMDLIFERFLTRGRTSLPDFDLDFPMSKREPLKHHVRERWGEDRVVTIGTVTTLRSKGAINSALKVLKPVLGDTIHWPDFQRLTALVDAANAPLAGAYMPWEQFKVEFEDDVAPMITKYPEVFALIDKFVGRVKSFGKHPAGVVISTEGSLWDLPLRLGENGEMITQFDGPSLEALGYVKCDLLTLRTLDTIQDTMDLIKEDLGVTINPGDWREEYLDPQVWEAISEGQTMGIFQVETRAGTRLTRQYKPTDIQGLADVMTLVRPGPKKSGLQDTYLDRRAGREQVSVPFVELEPVLGTTEGCLLYQEQIMQTFMVLAGYDENEADGVRKILGKKQIDKVEAAGQQFVARATALGYDPQLLAVLWAQMAEFAKYSFGKAHAVGYAMLGYWTAWFKFHFPVYFLTKALSTVDADRIPDFITESRRMGYKIYPPDINLSRVGFLRGQEDIRYGLDAVKGIGVSAAQEIVSLQPFDSLDDFVTRALEDKETSINRGHLSTLVAVGAFDSMVPNRRGLEMSLEHVSSGASKRCVFKDDGARGAPNNLPCRFDWDNEANPPMITKGRGINKTTEPKPPPKKCSVSCRNHTAPAPVSIDHIDPYTADDISRRESELLGVWLTHSPFDHVDPKDMEAAATFEDVESGGQGEYVVIAVVSEVKRKFDRNGNEYAFVSLQTLDGVIDTICFNSTYEKIRLDLVANALVWCIVKKNDRGVSLSALIPTL